MATVEGIVVVVMVTQAVEDVAPAALDHVPAAQFMHEAADVAPDVEDQVPALQ